MFDTVYDSVIPLVKSKYADNVQIIFRQQIQPWHPSSTLVHEVGAAVLQTNPGKFWEFSKVSNHTLFDPDTLLYANTTSPPGLSSSVSESVLISYVLPGAVR
jgi:hypothetical protein